MRVVDSSFVVDLVVTPSQVAWSGVQETWHAPQLLDVEFVSAIRGLLQGGHLDGTAAEVALEDYTSLGITVWPIDAALRRRVLALQHGLIAYDAAYVALAEALAAPLVTRDARLSRGAPPGLRVDLV